MKIHDLELFLIAAGRSESVAPARTLLVRATTASGLEGWGESSLGWRPGELAARRDALLAVLAGRSVYDVAELHTLEALSPPPLRSAIEMAVWDLLGRVLRQPLCNLLGGYYRRRVPVSARLTGCHPKTVAHVSRELAEKGFHTQTVATGGRPDEDLQNLSAIREMLGDRIELRFDGLGRFDAETARDLCAGLEFQGLQFFLDPLAAPELHALAALGRQTSVPLAAWRSIRGPADVLTAVRCGAAPFVVIDLEQVGGIVPARECAAVAAAAGVVPVLGRRASAGIATAAMLHLAAALPALATANEIATGQLRDSVLADSLVVADGMMPVPESHGLGVRVDRAKVEQRQPAM
jgi:L-alanine-DL-glutamate epimerase-like enolase superfamily enzyme